MKLWSPRFIPLVLLTTVLAGCGTALTCNNEFGAPPERELWCSPVKDLDKYFLVQPPKPAPEENVICTETLGDPDCHPKTALNGG